MFLKHGALALATVLASQAWAGDADGLEYPSFSLSGFGTFGAVHSSEKNADFTSTIFKPNGAGYSHDWSFDVDSRLGGQLNVNFTPRLSAVLQIVAEQRYDNSYTPTVEWANLKYLVTPDLSVRLGRIALPGFMVSEYRKVGYAIPWVRPPRDLYSLAQITNSDGFDASYRMQLGDVTNTVQAYYGQKNIYSTYNNGSLIKLREGYGLSNTVDLDPLTVRFSLQRGRLSWDDTRPFFEMFRRFGAAGNALADRYGLTEPRPYSLVSVGADYDPGQWFLSSEWARLRTNFWAGDGTAWYLGGGYRIRQFTPYILYSRVNLDSPQSDPGIPLQGLSPAQAAAARQLNATLNSLLGTLVPDQQTITIGTRWDVARNTALKLQYEHIDINPGSAGNLKNQQPDFVRGGKLNVISVTVDFVF